MVGQRSLTAMSVLVLCCLVFLLPAPSQAAPFFDRPARSTDWIPYLSAMMARQLRNAKRGCHGFPCLYQTLAANAGDFSIQQELDNMLGACANDPSCSPGKRRRRNAETDVPRLLRALLNSATSQREA